MDSSNLFAVVASVGLVFVVLYSMRKSTIVGLLAFGMNLATAAYWLVLDTSLPELAGLWGAISFGVLISTIIDFSAILGTP